jgi:lipopolysaccharide/colanic/teichoic acid biosynthesis glycosyltransferase
MQRPPDGRRLAPFDHRTLARRERWAAHGVGEARAKVGVVGSPAWAESVGTVAPSWRRQVVAMMDPTTLDGAVLTSAGVDELVVSSQAFAAMTAKLPYEVRSRMATIVGHDAALVFAPALSRRARAFKRVMDVTLGSVALVVAAPVLALSMVAVKLESRGPALFKQVRPGLDGRSFTMIKLRTMTTGSDDREHREYVESLIKGAASTNGGMFKLTADRRVTRVGRFLRRYSLDELPQLVNVVRGDMSLVGPRPPVVTEVDHYDATHWMRLRVKPGMTGAWQVAGRCELPYDHMVRLDIEYWQRWSVRSELRILARTLPVVLSGRGAA